MGLECRLYLHSSSGKEQVPRLSINGAPGRGAEGTSMGYQVRVVWATEASLLTGS